MSLFLSFALIRIGKPTRTVEYAEHKNTQLKNLSLKRASVII